MKPTAHPSVWMHAFADINDCWKITLWKPADSLADHVKQINVFAKQNLRSAIDAVEMVFIEI